MPECRGSGKRVKVSGGSQGLNAQESRKNVFSGKFIGGTWAREQ